MKGLPEPSMHGESHMNGIYFRLNISLWGNLPLESAPLLKRGKLAQHDLKRNREVVHPTTAEDLLLPLLF